MSTRYKLIHQPMLSLIEGTWLTVRNIKAHELYNFIKKNEDYIAHELPELAAEVRCNSKNEIRTVMEKVLATLRPFREGAKEISKSWAGRKAGVEEVSSSRGSQRIVSVKILF